MSLVSAILLTAGLSSRMKRCKLNLPFNAHTIIQEVVEQLKSSNVGEIIVVTGHYKSEINELIQEDSRTKLVHNPNYEKGMTTSIKCGLRSASSDATGYMICLGDMPFIQTKDYNTILDQFQKHATEPTIIRPFHKGQPGNPTIFSHHFKDEILKLAFTEGAKPLLKKYSKAVMQLEMSSDHIIRDIDTDLDYKSNMT